VAATVFTQRPCTQDKEKRKDLHSHAEPGFDAKCRPNSVWFRFLNQKPFLSL
jgi:hypothetical protein